MANLTPLACRAARALLEISTRELGERSGVAFETINKFENGRPMRESTKAKIAFVLEAAGVEILNGDAPGARLRRGPSKDERPLTDREKALLASMAAQIEVLGVLEEAGITHIGQDTSGLDPEKVRRLLADVRWERARRAAIAAGRLDDEA